MDRSPAGFALLTHECVFLRHRQKNKQSFKTSNFPLPLLMPPSILSNALQNTEGEQLIDYFAQHTSMKNYFSGLKS